MRNSKVYPEDTPEWACCLSCKYRGTLREFQGGNLIQDLRPLMKTEADFEKNLDVLEIKLKAISNRKCPKCGAQNSVSWMGKKNEKLVWDDHPEEQY